MLILDSLGCWVKKLPLKWFLCESYSELWLLLHPSAPQKLSNQGRMSVNAVFNQEILESAPICLKHVSTYFFCQQTIIDKKKLRSIQLILLTYKGLSEVFKVTTTADREFDQIRKWDEPDDSWWAAVLTQSSSATQQLPLSDLFCLKRCRKLLHQSSRVKCLFAEKCWCFKLKSLWEVLYPFILKLELQFNSQYKPNVLP